MSSMAGDASVAITRWPASVRCLVRRPLPHPISSTSPSPRPDRRQLGEDPGRAGVGVEPEPLVVDLGERGSVVGVVAARHAQPSAIGRPTTKASRTRGVELLAELVVRLRAEAVGHRREEAAGRRREHDVADLVVGEPHLAERVDVGLGDRTRHHAPPGRRRPGRPGPPRPARRRPRRWRSPPWRARRRSRPAGTSRGPPCSTWSGGRGPRRWWRSRSGAGPCHPGSTRSAPPTPGPPRVATRTRRRSSAGSPTTWSAPSRYFSTSSVASDGVTLISIGSSFGEPTVAASDAAVSPVYVSSSSRSASRIWSSAWSFARPAAPSSGSGRPRRHERARVVPSRSNIDAPLARSS